MNRTLLSKLLFGLFVLAALVDLVAVAADYSQIESIAKPSLMAVLLLYFFSKARNIPIGISIITSIALIFSLMGDIFMYETRNNPLMLAYGMLAFLMTHILYTIVFNVAYVRKFKKRVIVRRPIMALPLIIYGAIIFETLFVDSDNYQMPSGISVDLAVGIYIFFITLMALSAQNRLTKTTRTSFWEVFGGAMFFVFSDTLIAFREFLGMSFPLMGVIVMITYILAQYFIINGITRHYDDLAGGWVRADMREEPKESILEEFADPV